jgi:hypothetical protein
MKEEEERRMIVAAGRSLGGEIAELVEIFNMAWVSRSGLDQTEEDAPIFEVGNSTREDIAPLVRAFMLYRRIFPSRLSSADTQTPAMILSPPSSPTSKIIGMRRSLRRLLDLDCFEGEGLEDDKLSVALGDAKDRVNDMLVEHERAAMRAANF